VPPTFSRFRRPHTQSALLVLLLVVMLSVTGILTYQAQSEARRHQKTFERAVKINATFAAEQYRELFRKRVLSILWGLHSAANGGAEELGDDFIPVGLTKDYQEDCSCQPEHDVLYHFAYDFEKKTFLRKKGSPDPAELSALRKALESSPRLLFKPDWRFVLARIPGYDGVYNWAIRLSADTLPVYAIGFRARTDFLKSAVFPIDTFNTSLLQDSAIPKSATRFAITVSAGDDRIASGGGQAAGQAAVASLGEGFGGLVVRAWVNGDDHVLVAGTATPNALIPILVALMTLAIVLTALALYLLKRQSELAQLRSDFVANVSHEFRTPLAQIRMFTETLLLGRIRNDAERRRSLEVIDQEAKRLTALVENVLTLGRTDRNALKLTPAATELAPMVREVVEPFAQLPRSRNIEFKLELEPRLIATVDTNAFRQILLNLLDNAVKYGPAGQRVYVGLAMFEHTARLWVDDEGPGIAPRERERVFEPFFRSAPHVDGRIAGSGIGLAIVRELAGSLGGTARAEAAPGGGARLVVEFPEAYLRAEEAASGWAVA
jgi:signal transduction histidine kinase